MNLISMLEASRILSGKFPQHHVYRNIRSAVDFGDIVPVHDNGNILLLDYNDVINFGIETKMIDKDPRGRKNKLIIEQKLSP